MSSNQFGLLVAYLLPGFIGLAGIAPLVPIVTAWLRAGAYAEASLGPPMYAVLAASTVGMIVSCIRWVVIDHVHEWTGVTAPLWDDSCLNERLIAFNYLVENHYRYYQFYGNTLIAVVFAYAINRWFGTSPLLSIGTDIGAFFLCAALFAGSRDSLIKYYRRTAQLIGQVAHEGSEEMTNGNHHEGGGKASSQSHSEPKPERKLDASTRSAQEKPVKAKKGK